MEKHEQEKPKVLTVADIRKLNEGNHRCGWTFGAVKNPNPECGCMCGTVYNKDGEPILRYGGCHTGVQCKCFPPKSAEPAASSTQPGPERVSDADDHWRLLTVEEREQRWPKVIAELRTLRAQLAEKDAAIEKARRDALEEAERHINVLLQTEAISRDTAEKNGRKLVSECRAAGVECYQVAIAEIRALAAQKKKEG